MYDIVTIGSTTRDMFIEGDFPIIPWKKTPSGFAYALPRGEKLPVSKMYFTLGGNAANAAVTFARQGLTTACVSRVGNDDGGHEAVRRLRTEHVDTRHITYDKTNPTSYSILILENGSPSQVLRGKISEGERTILNYQGASNSLTLRDVPLEKLHARWWYLSSPGKSADTFPHLIHFANREKIRVGFNPTGYHLTHRRADILKALPTLSFLVMNDEESSLLTGIPFSKHEEIMRHVARQMKNGIFAMTLGPKGVLVSYNSHLYRAGIFKEKKIEDRTGAGDSFGAGFVAGLLQSEKRLSFSVKGLFGLNPKPYTLDAIKYAIRLASANATANVEHIGATEGTLTRAQFERESRWKKFPVKVEKI